MVRPVRKRVAVFSVVDWSLSTVCDWAADAGHEIALVVTLSPGKSAPGLRRPGVAGSGAVVMVVPTVSACLATLAELTVDLGIVFSFNRIPESVAGIPRHGTVNLHPSLLPAYRGPNGFRALYDGEARIGATLHYLTAELDAGPILAQWSDPVPEEVQPSTALPILQRAARAVLEAGVPRAFAGAAGEEQDPSAATVAPRFTEAEAVLTLALTSHGFQCRMSALALAGVQPWVAMDGEPRPLRAARLLRGLTAGEPGVVRLTERRAIVATADGVLELELGELLL
jgi:methionyl-tRNA formyltransferase